MTDFIAAVEKYGTSKAAYLALGISRSTFSDGLRRQRGTHTGRLGGKPPTADKPAPMAKASKGAPVNRLTFPAIPSRKEPIETLIARRTEHYQRIRNHTEAANWQTIGVNETRPIGLCLIGDPHIDDDGCCWPDLLRDTAVMRDTDGLYGVNIGDTTNNWVGRLARLFGNQETSQESARQMAEWWLTSAGIRWAAVILGNHDGWNEGGDIINRMCKDRVSAGVHDWAAKIEFAFPNGATCRVSLAHDFKGRSIYNAAHGLKREAIWHQDGAHLLAAGHIHYGEIGQCELPGGHNPWMVRVRGYKDYDHHALVNGYHEGRRFRSVVAIIDPTAPVENRVMVFGDVATGARALTALRAAHDEAAIAAATKPARMRSLKGNGGSRR